MSASPTTMQPGAAEAVEPHLAAVRRLGRIGALWVGAGLLPALAWLALAPLASAVIAPGHVKVDLNRRPVQHADGGIVAEVLVRDGERVSKGQPLLVLGDVPVAADVSRLGFRVLSERAALARLEAEQAWAPAVAFPLEVVQAARLDPRLAEQAAKERALFAARRDALEAQLRLLREQRARVAQEMAMLRAQIAQSERSLGHQREELDRNRALVAEAFVPVSRVSQIEAAVADYAVKLAEKQSDLVRAEQKLGDLALRERSLQSDYRQQASDQLRATAQRVAEIEQEHRKSSDAATRQVITAPAAGEIMGMKVTAPGSVIAPRETIAEIVPGSPRLLVEAQVRVDDIRHVRTGQPADIRFTAFNPRDTPPVQGRLAYVSADRLVDRTTQAPYYLAHIEADATALASAGLHLQAGMPAEVYVRGDERTPLQYLLEPITDVLRRSARDR